MSTMKSVLNLVAAAAVALSCAISFAAEPAGEPVKVGSLASMTGLTSTFGQSSDKGVRLAAEERNKVGGVLGRPVEIDTADTESSADKTPLAVLKLIEQDKVVAVLGEVASSRSHRRRTGMPAGQDSVAVAGLNERESHETWQLHLSILLCR